MGVHDEPEHAPALFHMAQLSLVDLDTLAELLGTHENHLDEAKQKYPDSPRLQQLYILHKSELRRISWNDLLSAHQAARSLGHKQASIKSATAESSGSTSAEARTTDVALLSRYLEEEKLEQDIRGRIAKLPAQEMFKSSLEARADTWKLAISRDMIRAFSVALRIHPDEVKTRSGSLSVQIILENANAQLINFGWNHIGLALHVTGMLGANSHIKSLKNYIERFGSIIVEPVARDTTYHEAGKRVSELLSEIEIMDAMAKIHAKEALEKQKESECAVCLEFSRPVNILLMPCQHFGICGQCTPKLSTCPGCRRKIDYTIDTRCVSFSDGMTTV